MPLQAVLAQNLGKLHSEEYLCRQWRRRFAKRQLQTVSGFRLLAVHGKKISRCSPRRLPAKVRRLARDNRHVPRLTHFVIACTSALALYRLCPEQNKMAQGVWSQPRPLKPHLITLINWPSTSWSRLCQETFFLRGRTVKGSSSQQLLLPSVSEVCTSPTVVYCSPISISSLLK